MVLPAGRGVHSAAGERLHAPRHEPLARVAVPQLTVVVPPEGEDLRVVGNGHRVVVRARNVCHPTLEQRFDALWQGDGRAGPVPQLALGIVAARVHLAVVGERHEVLAPV